MSDLQDPQEVKIDFEGAYLLGCQYCNKLIQSLSTGSKIQRFSSLVENHNNHLKARHPDEYSENQELLQQIAGAIGTMIWVDECVRKIDSSKAGRATIEMIDEALKEAEEIVDTYFHVSGMEDGQEGEEIVEETNINPDISQFEVDEAIVEKP